MNYLVNGKEIVIGNKRKSFDNDIFELCDTSNEILITLKNMSTGDVQKQPLNNIVAIDKNAEIIWNIADVTKVDIYYSGFYLIDTEVNNQVLVAIDCKGIRYFIRLSDLKIIDKQGSRF